MPALKTLLSGVLAETFDNAINAPVLVPYSRIVHGAKFLVSVYNGAVLEYGEMEDEIQALLSLLPAAGMVGDFYGNVFVLAGQLTGYFYAHVL